MFNLFPNVLLGQNINSTTRQKRLTSVVPAYLQYILLKKKVSLGVDWQ